MSMLGEKVNASGKRLPLFASVLNVSTIPESNEDGSWAGWKISWASWNVDPLHREMAIAFYKQVAAGKVEVNYEQTATEAKEEDDNF